MTTDPQLLTQFVRANSEAAFAELVNRHVNLVYSAALRQLNGDAHLAKDVVQTVFTDLARKADALASRESVAGWLYTSAHFAAAKVVRQENRRREREEKFMREPVNENESAPDADWEKIRPALDAVMHELKDADREAILLRYFENRQFTAVGAELGLNEDTSRKRVERALEKLRVAFAKRGITTAGALAAVIAANASQMAPASLTTTLPTTAIAAAGTGTFTLLKFMTATKIKLGLSALLAASAATALMVQHQSQQKLHDENSALQQQIAHLQTDNASFSNQLAAAGSTKLAADQFSELLKLRGQVGVLQRQIGELGKLRAENRQLQTAQADANVQQQGARDAKNEEHAIMLQKLDAAKEGVLAFILYAGDHPNQYPTNFAQAASYISTNYTAQIEDNFDMAYQGQISSLTNPSATIVLKEKQAWLATSGKWMKTYGFADGHSEVHTEPSGNFDDYENNHAASPAPGQ
jgi:RNA polymerase sigma factor (sigma-70 family)